MFDIIYTFFLNGIMARTFDKPILVTRPYLPPLEDFRRGLEEVWANQWLSNNGPLVKRFQHVLAVYFGVADTNLALFANSTHAFGV